MHKKSLIALLLLLSALAALAAWQLAREEQGERAADRALCEGFDPARVVAIRVDNLERSLQLRLERRADQTFEIVDPIAFPAEMAVIERLLDALATQRASTSAFDDPAAIGLDPPRVVLEVEEDVGGARHVRRIEIGAADGEHVFARAGGELVRTERALDSTLERDLPDWRRRAILTVAPRNVIELERRGEITFPGEPAATDLGLAALLDGRWRSTAPFQAQLDENLLAYWLGAAAFLRAADFVDDPGALSNYGLDRPQITLVLTDPNGRREVVWLTPEPGRELWLCAVEGSPHVYRVPYESVLALAAPSPGFVDRQLLRVQRERVAKVTLALDGRELELETTEKRWRVTARDGETTSHDRVEADGARVADLLAELERARTVELFLGRTWNAGESRGRIEVVTVDGDRHGGEIGPRVGSADGTESVLFRRFDDGLVAGLAPALLDLTRTDPDSLRSLELHKVAELEVARIHLERGGVERVYVRGERGRWSRQGSEVEAKEFARLVDRILSMRAVQMLERGLDDVLTDRIDVRIVLLTGNERRFALGRRADPVTGEGVPVYRSDDRLGRLGPELQDDLARLFAE